ncbi:MAG TPA: PaaI family thioesterase [Solirubrobacteraceae bacterium]|nr:PaaI family thioesterase [Solirubrobacteraceae bacterium]
MGTLIGAELVSVDDGEAVFRCAPDESTYNPIGMVHGGLLCTLLDSAAGSAVHTLLPAGAGYGTIEIKVSFLEPLYADAGEIEVHGHALRVGGRVAFAEAHARDTRGRLVGHATTSIAVIQPSARKAIPQIN